MSPRSYWRSRSLVMLLVFAACTKVPFTNRSQLILVSPDEETKLGAQAFKQVLSKGKVVKDDALTRPVLGVGQRLARAANRSEFKWEFAVIDDRKQVNAFALPGGKVAVYTGILPVAQTTNGLAVVLGHEIAHVLARHGAERMSQGMVTQVGGSLLGAFLGGGASAQAVMVAYGLGTQFGILLPYSRTQESEADHIGLLLMARAGYDPREALAFWQRMEKVSGGGGRPPEFISTHPSHGTREQQIEAWLPEALRYYDASARAPDETLVSAASLRIALAPTSVRLARALNVFARPVRASIFCLHFETGERKQLRSRNGTLLSYLRCDLV